jgi:glycosyltransferase involved in cell wall biosynthesis
MARRGSLGQAGHGTAPQPAQVLRVALLVSNLEYGGAQRQVVELANRLNAGGHDVHVCTLSDYVPLAAALHESDRRLHVVAKRGKFDFGVVARLAALFRSLDTRIVHAFLFDAEIAARLAGRLLGNVKVVGSERNSDYVRKWRHTAALRMTARWCDLIVANSEAGRRFQMRSLGLAESAIRVVYNGVDTKRFCPGSGAVVRGELGLAADTPVVGMFASFKTQKNHAMYFRVARRVLDVLPDARFLCVGGALHGGLQSSDAYHEQMMRMIEDLGLSKAVRCLGNRDDVVDVYRACDLTALTSYREGTPNVLLESMACGVPVVATEAADNRIIVPEGRGGFVVKHDADEAMADRMIELLSTPARRRECSLAAREWTEQRFSTACLAANMEAVYRSLVGVAGDGSLRA